MKGRTSEKLAAVVQKTAKFLEVAPPKAEERPRPSLRVVSRYLMTHGQLKECGVYSQGIWASELKTIHVSDTIKEQ